MKLSKKSLMGTLAVAGTIALTVTTGFAAEKLGTVTGKDGDIKDKVQINAEVKAVDGSQVTFKDIDTQAEYEASFGPSWHSKAYEAGEKVTVVGVETEEGNNDNGHNFQVMEVNGTVLRNEFEGKPNWGGKGGNGQGNGSRDGSGAGQGMKNGGGTQQGGSFVDANGDGACDNA